MVSMRDGGRLKIAKGLPYAEAFMREMQGFKATVGENGHVAYGSEGEHNDLVIAVALVVLWCANKQDPV